MFFLAFSALICPSGALSGSTERLYIETRNSASRQMPKDKKGEGFHSAAGLIRYFDQEDEKALKVNPWIVVSLCIAISTVVLVLGVLYPT